MFTRDQLAANGSQGGKLQLTPRSIEACRRLGVIMSELVTPTLAQIAR